jgi:hypothetical protein
MQVRHKTYGRGVVKASRWSTAMRLWKCTLRYRLKALVASLAKLEIL